MVTNNYRDVSSSVLKSQHIQRRNGSLVVQGVPAIKGIESIKQNPVRRKRPAPLKLPEIRRSEPELEESVKKPFSVVKNIKFSPNILLMIFCLLVVAFFSYYALLWKDEKIDIKPNIDAQIRKRMLEYAAGNSLAIKLPSETPPGNAETFSWLNYTIKKGDSVSKIAADHSLSMDAVIASNNMTNARNLREGEIIRIPNMDGIPYTVKKGVVRKESYNQQTKNHEQNIR
ncbi:hypothetical protein AGMMS50212_16060 [Spirochaetia bacterium]|nr:hypothetical protein AGMMS50212_16060 [Spirochaetia bacterium]